MIASRLGAASAALAVAAGTSLAQPVPAVAEQLNAREGPEVSGPLSTDPALKSCKKTSRRTETGQLIARFHVCTRYYRFGTNHENDSDSNYGAFWIQATVDAKNGWCAKQTTVAVSWHGGVRNKAPAPGTFERAKHRERFKTKLIVDADGHADTTATIKNSFALLPGKLRSRLLADPKLFRVRWTGGSKNKVALVAGLELSWPQGGQAPEITPKVQAIFDRMGC
jgi:hypothetical protein